MAEIYKENIVDIDLAKGRIHRKFLAHSIGTADSSADRFGIRVFRGHEEVDLSGCSCYGYFLDPMGNSIALTSYGTVDGNVAYVTLPQACYNYEGQFTLSIKLIGGGVTGTMRIVDGVVDNTNTGGAVAPTSTVPTYSEIISQYDAMVAATAAANGCIAETFDATKAYSAGQYVINSGSLYRLTSDHAANVTWANTSKVEVKFGNELSDVKSAFAENFDATKKYTAGQYVIYNGSLYRLNADHAENVTWANTSKSEVKVGDEIHNVKNSLNSTIVDAYVLKDTNFIITKGQYINKNNGKATSGDKYARSNILIGFPTRLGFNITNTDYEYVIVYYDSTGNVSTGDGFIGHSGGYRTGIIILPQESVRCSMSIRRVDNATISDADVTAIHDAIKAIIVTDTSLTMSGKTADAKVVGDQFGYIKNEINRLENIVDFGDHVGESSAATTGNYGHPAITRDGAIVTVDGSVGGSAGSVVRISGDLAVTYGNAGVDALGPTGYEFTAGHTYRAFYRVLSGSNMDGSTRIASISIYKNGEHSTTGAITGYPGKDYERIWTADGSKYNVCLFLTAGKTFSNTVFMIYVQDITGLSTWYENEINDTAGKVLNEITSPALVFPWVTDIHRWQVNDTVPVMVANMAEVGKKVKYDFILNTGDTIDGTETQENSLAIAKECTQYFKNIGEPYMFVQGNHDNNIYSGTISDKFDLKQIYSGLFNATKGGFYNASENGTDYYIDFPDRGVRLISLNSANVSVTNNYAYGNSTAEWLENALDTEYAVIVATHVSPVPAHVWSNNEPTNAAAIRSALSAFVNGGGKMILLTGHSHVDAEWIDPYIEITDVCQRDRAADISGSGAQAITGMINGIRSPERTNNTATIDAWCVAVYRPMDNELALIRFGAGVDRYIHCTEIAPTTLTTKLSGTITWSSSNTSVATVSSGVVTGIATGKCAIMAKDESGNFEVWIVSVA